MTYRTTGVTAECRRCGATDVPMAWSSSTNQEIHLYRHKPGEPYAGKGLRGATCTGPDDLFTILLVDEGLMRCNGHRVHLMTRQEEQEFQQLQTEPQRHEFRRRVYEQREQLR